MRKIHLLLAIALIGIVFISGCSSGSSSGTPTYFMRAAVNGSTAFNAASCIASVVSSDLGISGSTLTGSAGGPPQININIPSWSGSTGTFAITSVSTAANFAQYIASASSSTSLSQSGSLIISSVSTTTISGTFYFTCTDGTTITAGSFSAKRY